MRTHATTQPLEREHIYSIYLSLIYQEMLDRDCKRIIDDIFWGLFDEFDDGAQIPLTAALPSTSSSSSAVVGDGVLSSGGSSQFGTIGRGAAASPGDAGGVNGVAGVAGVRGMNVLGSGAATAASIGNGVSGWFVRRCFWGWFWDGREKVNAQPRSGVVSKY